MSASVWYNSYIGTFGRDGSMVLGGAGGWAPTTRTEQQYARGRAYGP